MCRVIEKLNTFLQIAIKEAKRNESQKEKEEKERMKKFIDEHA